MKETVANILLELGCVKISPSDPFTYASGLKGPIYCDNRKVLGHPTARKEIVKGFIKVIQDNNLKYDHLAGLATAGIPHASFLAHELDQSMVYVRSKPKGHGKGNQVEGDYQKGQSVLLVEDLVNQASSLLEALSGLEKEELKPVGCLSIVDYQMDVAKERLEKANLTLYSLTDFDSLVNVLKNKNSLSSQDIELLKKWHADPKNWG